VASDKRTPGDGEDDDTLIVPDHSERFLSAPDILASQRGDVTGRHPYSINLI
jgi:hypothetical protein